MFTNAGHVESSILVKSNKEGVWRVLILVGDTGIGIDPDKYGHIFQAYAQAASPEFIMSGSGLGLAICKNLVALMDGTIAVESVLGEGSMFTVELSLPAARIEARQSPLTRVPAPRRAPLGGSILVVEDQELNAQVLTRMLDQLGLAAHVVGNGKDALVRLNDTHYDVILMDCHMPIMDGYECTRQIRQMESSAARTPIIAVTADAMPESRKRSMDAGMDEYLIKPILLDDLREVLAKYLS
jgi:CheY-like chemotaxis protein